MTMQPCPSCGEARLGSFRFCRLCGFDYDQPTPEKAADQTADPARAAPDAPGSPDGPDSPDAMASPARPASPDVSFVPFDLFPKQSNDVAAPGLTRSDPWSRGGVLTGVVVVGGILVVFIALLVFRPLG